jgi:hypothetical protein
MGYNDHYSHAVCRSAELLSCAKTAVKIAKARGEEWAASAILSLAAAAEETTNGSPATSSSSPSSFLEDGVTLLRTMDAALEHLDQLVKRRGHTNDPTVEINATVASLEEDVKEMAIWIPSVMPVCRGQRERHWLAVQEWFQKCTQQQNAHLKRALDIRANVLAEQALRRQRFQHQAKSTTVRPKFQPPPPPTPRVVLAPPPPPPPAKNLAETNGGSSTSIHHNSNGTTSSSAFTPPPPFSNTTSTARASSSLSSSQQSYNNNNISSSSIAPPSLSTNGIASTSSVAPTVSTTRSSSTASNPYESYYAPSAGYGAGTSSNVMRQRRGGGGVGSPQHVQQQQQQQQYMQSNASQQRVEEAVLVEQTLASIGQLYGKMSSVIAEQAEQITSIEDDVEAAHTDVLHGREQIGILYEIKKGNRPLILKTYALLIFFIVVMRFYAK